MSDITELAQSLKAAAIDAKELAIIARYSKGRAAAEKFYALANPNNVIALVEALEKAQQRIAELESRTVKLPQRHSMLLREDFNEDYHTEIAYKADEVHASLAASGIKVEAE
ncbi:TPA: ead/Ea22-like family protein [Klebsiella pneumoniae]|nr:ead/Ea22-like family protein [Klebsiella pneumoniae]HBY9951389.1 ead/Ea22-like family protein [Klebsiella pneumoniae]